MRVLATFGLAFLQLNMSYAKRGGAFFESKIIHRETTHSNGKWMRLGPSAKANISQLLGILNRSKTGKQLILDAHQKAKSEGKTLAQVLFPGEGSLTDTTLIRKFSPATPFDVEYESRSKVYINRDLNVVDAVLDLAHELTHFVYRMPFNPYTTNFSLKAFIHSTIEGRGGEVDAYIMECQVYRELFPRRFSENQKCQSVIDQRTQEFSKKLGTQLFYRLGGYTSDFVSEMKDYGVTPKYFPHLSQDEAQFISSAYGLPYPMAALKEYIFVMKRACANDQKRFALFDESRSRAPAGSFAKRQKTAVKKAYHQFESRCVSFLQ